MKIPPRLNQLFWTLMLMLPIMIFATGYMLWVKFGCPECQ